MKTHFTYSLFVIILISSCGSDPEKKNPCWMEECIDFWTIDCEPAWSPDGQWIAYNHFGDIYLIRPDGSDNTLWHQGGGMPAWSPDGQWIVFSQYGQIWKKKMNGNSLNQLTFEGSSIFPACSSDGNLIACVQSVCKDIPCGVWTYDLSKDTYTNTIRYGMFPNFHPSLNQLLYVTSFYLKDEHTMGDSVFVYNYDTKKERCIVALKNPNSDNHYFKYHPMGSKILFTSKPDTGDGLQDTWIMNADGTECRELIERGYAAAWSPDGAQIVYTDSRTGDGRLWIMDMATGNRRQLTFENMFP